MIKPMSIYGQFIDPSKLLMVNPLIGFYGVFESPHSFWVARHFGPSYPDPALTLAFPRWTGAGDYEIEIAVYLDYNLSKRPKCRPMTRNFTKVNIADLDEYRQVANRMVEYGQALSAMDIDAILHKDYLQIFRGVVYNYTSLAKRSVAETWRLNRFQLLMFNRRQSMGWHRVHPRQSGKRDIWDRLYKGLLEQSITPYPLDRIVLKEHLKSRKHLVDGEVDVDYMQLYRNMHVANPVEEPQIKTLHWGRTTIPSDDYMERMRLRKQVLQQGLGDPHVAIHGHRTLTSMCRTAAGKIRHESPMQEKWKGSVAHARESARVETLMFGDNFNKPKE